ncbi:hypothetical protein COO60DRAFT_1573102, partial [Scenedesmus sp. NREL 46B-D3]
MLLVISHVLIVRVLKSRLWVQLCTSMRTGRCTVLCLTIARAGRPLPLACNAINRDISFEPKREFDCTFAALWSVVVKLHEGKAFQSPLRY